MIKTRGFMIMIDHCCEVQEGAKPFRSANLERSGTEREGKVSPLLRTFDNMSRIIIKPLVLIILFWILFFHISCGLSLHDVVSEVKLAEAFKYNAGKIRSFRGMGRAYFSLQEKEGAVDIVAISEKPDRMRIEVGGLLGIPLSVLVTSRQKLTYYAIPEEKYYVGRTQENISRHVLPLGLTEKDLLGFLLFDEKAIQKLKGKKQYKLEIFELTKDEETRGLYYPEGFKVTDIRTKDTLQVVWEEFDINPPAFSKIHFVLKKPPQAMLISFGSKTTPLFPTDNAEEP